MITLRLSFTILLINFIVLLSSVFSQNYTQMELPEGAKGRIGKGFITGNIVYSPDSSRLAVASSIGTWIYNAETGEELNLLTNHIGFIKSIAFSPDNKTLVVSSGSEFYIWDVDSGELQMTISAHIGNISDIKISPDGTQIATCGNFADETIKLWDSSTGSLITTIDGFTDRIYSISFSPDGRVLASCVEDDDINIIKLWDVSNSKLRSIFTIGTNAGSMISTFSPDGKILANTIHSFDERIQLWDVTTSSLRSTLLGHTGGVESISFSSDGKTLASGSDDRNICLWDVNSGSFLTVILEHTENVVSVAFSPDGNTLATGSRDGSVVLWDTETYMKKYKITGHNEWINEFAFTPDGRTIVSGSLDRTVRLWDTQTGRNIKTFLGHNSSVISVAISPDGKTIASGGRLGHSINGWFADDFSIKLWDVDSDEPIRTLIGHYSDIYHLSFSKDGSILTSSSDGDIILWDVKTGNPLWTLGGDRDNPMGRITFSPDGNSFITWGRSGIQFWDLHTKQPIPSYIGLPDGFAYGDYSHDGRTLAVSDVNQDVHLLNISNGVYRTIQTGHYGRFTIPVFSLDGKVLVTGSFPKDKTIRFWDLENNELKYTISNNPDQVYDIKFSPDGKTIATTGKEGVIYLWDYPFAIEQPTQIADINSDGVVDISDLVLVAANFGKTGENVADVNGDGIVNITDLITVAAAINNANAAPSLNAETIQQWITDAHHLQKNDPVLQKGILFLEQLLKSYTPKTTTLLPNYPNPFNPETWIPYQLSEQSDVTIRIYASNGQLIRTIGLGIQQAGIYQDRTHAAYWDGKNDLGEHVASGVYFYELTAGQYSFTRQMVIQK
ncbi:T9SS type A sorting domain-containing protein [Candidatus Poribacteria bacterium]|nr:T9SS type A sorting domain-containing protein [Candidatus Poribacteria bacterium]